MVLRQIVGWSLVLCLRSVWAEDGSAAAPGPVAKTGQAAIRGAEKAGSAIERGAQKTGQAIARGVTKTGRAIERGGKAVDRGVKRAAKKMHVPASVTPAPPPPAEPGMPR